MARLFPFTRRRWTRPEDYGQVLPTHRWQGLTIRRRVLNWLTAWKPWGVLALILGGWYWLDPALVEPPAFLSGEPEHVSGTFTRCGPGRGAFCVIDGDTFKLGNRSVRLIGIDAPETHPSRCPAETVQGEAATALLQRLLNQAPFTMRGRIDGGRDLYGRDLRAVTRVLNDGSVQSIADEMLASGTVRGYLGGLRESWC